MINYNNLFYLTLVHILLLEIQLMNVMADVVSHLVMQVYLSPAKEQQLYNISMTIPTGTHEGSLASLRNKETGWFSA